MRDKNHIQSVDRALKILEILGESPRPLSLTEVARRAGLIKTTAQRFINTLTSLGYLIREENKRYALGAKTLSLGFRFLNSSSLVSVSRPYLDELSTALEATVNLAVLDHCDVLVLYRREVRRFLKFDIHPGSKLLAYGSSLGRALLAGLPDEEILQRLDQMDIKRLTPRTVVSKEGIMELIAETRDTGYAISDQEQSMDLCSIATPLLNDQNQMVAVINVSLDAMKRSDADNVEAARVRLLSTGERISRLLGYEGPYPRIFV
ncbi:MAG: IclR family transcriptional regulator [Proteobacteria bacterium]|nr:IclR family transcriptional regulator [Pseudomonadota bacterium]